MTIIIITSSYLDDDNNDYYNRLTPYDIKINKKNNDLKNAKLRSMKQTSKSLQSS